MNLDEVVYRLLKVVVQVNKAFKTKSKLLQELIQKEDRYNFSHHI